MDKMFNRMFPLHSHPPGLKMREQRGGFGEGGWPGLNMVALHIPQSVILFEGLKGAGLLTEGLKPPLSPSGYTPGPMCVTPILYHNSE